MKSITNLLICNLLIIFLSVFSLTGNSQTFDYFENNPKWRGSIRIDVYPQINLFNTYNYIQYVDGDTIINDTTYLKLYWEGIYHEVSSVPVVFNELSAMIRQNDFEVYQRINDIDKKVYDFNLEIGDTLPETYYYTQNQIDPVIILGIDSLEINGNQHRIFDLAPNGSLVSDYLIEGIGHDAGFTGRINMTVNGNARLHCYSQNDIEYFRVGDRECNFDVSMEEIIKDNGISLYPNPCNETLTIIGLKSTNYYINVVSASGKMVINKNRVNSNVDVSNLKSGIYAINIIDGRGILYSDVFIKH